MSASKAHGLGDCRNRIRRRPKIERESFRHGNGIRGIPVPQSILFFDIQNFPPGKGCRPGLVVFPPIYRRKRHADLLRKARLGQCEVLSQRLYAHRIIDRYMGAAL